jgi:drug/metabolite transporter (DMT)-like permease
MDQNRKALYGPLMIAICALLWSTGGLFIKMVDAPAVVIAGLRSLIAIIIIWAWLKKPKFTFSPVQIGAAFANALTMLLFVYANKATTSANAILLQYASPIWTAFLAVIFLREKIRFAEGCILLLASGGLILFFMDSLGTGALLGNLAAIASGISFSIFYILMRKQKDGSPLESLLLSHCITLLVSLPFLSGFTVNLPNVSGILLLGVFQIGIAAIFFSVGIKGTTALQASLISLVEPIFNPVWVLLLTGETPTLLTLIGGAIIVVCVTASSLVKILSPVPVTEKSDSPLTD